MTLAQYLGTDELFTYIDVISALKAVRTPRDFVSCVEGEVRRLLPHEGMIAGLGKLRPTGIEPLHVVMHRFPDDYLETLRQPCGSIDGPAIAAWRTRRAPVALSAAERACIRRSGRHSSGEEVASGNLIGHGQTDSDGNFTSFFTFHRLPQIPGVRHAVLMRYLVPHLHEALLQTCPPRAAVPVVPPVVASGESLTERQRDVLCHLHRGLSNKEIARLLGTTEHNIKYLVGQIIRRLNVTNRVEAVARAVHLRLIDDS